MGLRFGRRISILPGVRLNISGSGLGLSVGPRGASMSINRHGVYGNVGLPGTGLSYRTKLTGNSKKNSIGKAAPDLVNPISTIVNNDGKLIFRDGAGTELNSAQAKMFLAQNSGSVGPFLVSTAAFMNEDLQTCLNIHRLTTAPGTSIPIPDEFDGSYKPKPPIAIKPGLVDRLLGRREKFIELNDERESAYQAALIDWQAEYMEFNASRSRVIQAMSLVASNDIKAMEVVAEYLLNRITWPRVTDIGFGISACGQVVGIDLDLPDEDEVPTTSASVGVNRLIIKARTEAQLRRDFVALAYGSVFRVTGELFAGLPTISKVVISSYVQRRCEGTGNIKDVYVMSSIIDRGGWSQINFSQLDTIDPAAAIGMFELRVKPDRSSRLQEIVPFEMIDSFR